jgi:hypothetical protein
MIKEIKIKGDKSVIIETFGDEIIIPVDNIIVEDSIYGRNISPNKIAIENLDYIKRLSESILYYIKEKGKITSSDIPAIVVSEFNGKTYLVDGLHRLEAYKSLGFTDVIVKKEKIIANSWEEFSYKVLLLSIKYNSLNGKTLVEKDYESVANKVLNLQKEINAPILKKIINDLYTYAKVSSDYITHLRPIESKITELENVGFEKISEYCKNNYELLIDYNKFSQDKTILEIYNSYFITQDLLYLFNMIIERLSKDIYERSLSSERNKVGKEEKTIDNEFVYDSGSESEMEEYEESRARKRGREEEEEEEFELLEAIDEEKLRKQTEKVLGNIEMIKIEKINPEELNEILSACIYVVDNTKETLIKKFSKDDLEKVEDKDLYSNLKRNLKKLYNSILEIREVLEMYQDDKKP